MNIIRERVTRAAVSAIVNNGLTFYGSNWAGESAGWFFDVAMRAGASEYVAAEIALDELGQSLVKEYTAIYKNRDTAGKDLHRAHLYVCAGQYMVAAARGFADEGRKVVFDRLVSEAERTA